MRNPQLNPRGELTHLLTTEGLSRLMLTRLLDTAAQFLSPSGGEGKDTPLLKGKTVLSVVDEVFADKLPFELEGYERVAKRLSADWLGSKTLKPSSGTVFAELEADIVVLRTQVSGTPYWFAQRVGPHVHIINAGDGIHADPTRALLDMLMIRSVKKDFSNLTVALVGAVSRSRQARSCIHALTTLCVAEVRAIAPLTLLPEGLAQLGVRAYTDLAKGLREVDVIIRLDQELDGVENCFFSSAQEYSKCYGLTEEKRAYAKPDCLILEAEADNHEREAAGIAVRMAAMSLLAGASA